MSRPPALRSVTSLLALAPAALLAACPGNPQCEGSPPDPTPSEIPNPYEGFQDIELPGRRVVLENADAGTLAETQVEIANLGPQPLTLLRVALSDDSDPEWTLDPLSVPASIPAESSAAVTLQVLHGGFRERLAILEIESDDPDEPEAAVGLLAPSNLLIPQANIDPARLDFGFVFTAAEERASLLVGNAGDGSVSILSAAVESAGGPSSFALSCPGVPLSDCDWANDVLPALLATPLGPGQSTPLEISFIPGNLQPAAAELVLATDDPQRPELRALLRGNGEGALGCTAPSVAVTQPDGPQSYELGAGEHLLLEVLVDDAEQPPETLLVELWSGSLLIEDELADATGAAAFDVHLDVHEPAVPAGLQTLTVRATDACQLFSEAAFVAAVGEAPPDDDADGDGWGPGVAGDCDDGDAARFPGQVELADGVDQDCDGVTDEGTTAWDDDGDGTAEAGGDCDDRDASIGPEATEIPNQRDDDCDGRVDEGTTLSDDDGDGQTEAGGDCDDTAATVFAGAHEWCDGVDGDCDGALDGDDDCVATDSAPRTVGPLVTSRFATTLGSEVEVSVIVLSSHPDEELDYEWVTDMGSFVSEDGSPTAIWRAPADTEGNDGLIGRYPALGVTVEDPEGRSDLAFGNLQIIDGARPAISAVGTGTCACSLGSGSGAAAGAGGRPGLLWFFLLAFASLVSGPLARPRVAEAAELAGVTLADSLSLGGKALALNGAGIRTKLFIKVYVGGLYVESRAHDASAILRADGARAIVMHLLMDLDAEKITSSIDEGFENNSAGQMDALRARLDRLKAMFPSVKKGDVLQLAWIPGRGTVVTHRGKELGVIEGRDFADALFAVWLGGKPCDGDLKEGMLGI
jgi:hypothetical protein